MVNFEDKSHPALQLTSAGYKYNAFGHVQAHNNNK